MAYSRQPFIAQKNSALKEADIAAGANPNLWSIEDIIEVYGGWPRKINNQTVLRYKIDIEAVLEREKQIMLNEFKKNIDKEIENKILMESNKIREDLLEKQGRLHTYIRGGQTSHVSTKSLKHASLKKDDSFGLNLINEFLKKIKEIDFNTDMRFFEIDQAEPVFKNKPSGGKKKKTERRSKRKMQRETRKRR